MEVTPKGSLNGARRYTYNDAGYLAQVESHDGASYQLQAEMTYNGLGQRLAMTAYALGQSVTTQYTLDTAWSGYPLVADADGQSTFYFYGRGAVAEKTTAWSYYLKDGQGTARQLADPSGLVTLARTFTPWGETLEQADPGSGGDGDLAWGYFGGYMDAATGLLYVGNGQYYAPATGRFLTRQPGRINPYVPWSDPLGSSVGVLGLLGMLRRRKRKRKGKLSRLDMLALLLVVLAGGASLAACDGAAPVGPSPIPPTQPPGDTLTPSPAPSVTPSLTPSPAPSVTPSLTPVPPPTGTPILTPTFCTPTVTPSPTPSDSQSWQEDPDVNNWGDPSNTNHEWDMERARRVWRWICNSGGWWGAGCPGAYDLTVWLLWQEGGGLLNDTVFYLSPGVPNQSALKAALTMVTYIRDLLIDGPHSAPDSGKSLEYPVR